MKRYGRLICRESQLRKAEEAAAAAVAAETAKDDAKKKKKSSVDRCDVSSTRLLLLRS
jgi:hypothetical protein